MSDILDDPAYRVPPPADGEGAIAWFRASVSRFANGPTHARRRAIAEAAIAGLDDAALRQDAYRKAAGGAWETAAVEALAHGLGVAEPHLTDVARDVRTTGSCYRAAGTADEEAKASAAVERLLPLLGGPNEIGANRLALLVQASAACEALVANALRRGGDRGVDELIDETLEEDPPVPSTARLAPSGELVEIPLSGERAFGSGFRSCPGKAVGLALAAGVLEARRERV